MPSLARIIGRAPARDGDAAALPVDLDPREFVARLTPDAPVLDVRTADEFTLGHLEGARNLDMFDDRFLERVEALGLDPEQPIYLYCRSGNRSGHAARMLRQHGYAQAFNVGGLDELVQEGAPTAS